MANEKEQGIRSVIENLSATVGEAFRRAEGQLGTLTGKKLFAVDVIEYGDSYLVEANLPGVRKEDVEVSIEGGRLTIRATKSCVEDLGDGSYLCQERWCGSGARTIELADAADSEDAQATLKDGVLSLRLKKADRKQARKVNID